MTISSMALASGPFGPPQTVSREDGGLNTAIGYWYHEDTFKNETDHTIRQNQIYSQVAYGAKNIWEIYGRVGISDLKFFDAFTSTGLTTSNKLDFEENWKFFGTLGAKGFFPFNKIIGIGAFIQGTYHFSNYTDDVSGSDNLIPYTAELKIKNLWDVNCGMGLQVTAPFDIKFYAGPFVYYSAARASMSPNISGLEYAAGNVKIRNKSIFGGFAGIDIPLFKSFHLNVESQYAERFSAGAAVSLVY